jgi:hypothetical protein
MVQSSQQIMPGAKRTQGYHNEIAIRTEPRLHRDAAWPQMGRWITEDLPRLRASFPVRPRRDPSRHSSIVFYLRVFLLRRAGGFLGSHKLVAYYEAQVRP